MIATVLLTLFLACLITLGFTYFGYLFYVKSCSGNDNVSVDFRKPKNTHRGISIVIPTYNEERVIAKKLENTLSFFDHKDPIEIIVADDGSTDGTLNIVKELKALKLQIVVVGKIEKNLVPKLTKFNNLYPGNFSFYSSGDEKLMHIITAGCDVILLPFLYYWSEINPLNCLKYGTVPIVRNIGDFSDVIVEFNAKNNSGNGLLIKEYSSTEILKQFKNAIKLFNKEKIWSIIQKNGMKEEFLWENTAKKFLKVYSSALRNQK